MSFVKIFHFIGSFVALLRICTKVSIPKWGGGQYLYDYSFWASLTLTSVAEF